LRFVQGDSPLFFFLSKTAGPVLLPTNFMIGLGLIGLVLLATRFKAAGRRLMAASILLLAVCAYSPLGGLLLSPLERRFPAWEGSGSAPDGIIVLGGQVDPDLSADHGRPVVSGRGGRIIAAAELARRYPKARVVLAGGSSSLVQSAEREADHSVALLENLGVARERIVVERNSRNTYENAAFSRAQVQPQPGERWLLVTSAYHMPRAVGLFRQAGFPVEAYPVDWRVGETMFSIDDVSAARLGQIDIAAREWIGLVAYRLAGRTRELLPGPNVGNPK